MLTQDRNAHLEAICADTSSRADQLPGATDVLKEELKAAKGRESMLEVRGAVLEGPCEAVTGLPGSPDTVSAVVLWMRPAVVLGVYVGA